MILIAGQYYEADPAVAAYINSLEEDSYQRFNEIRELQEQIDLLKAENEYHIAKIKSIHQEFKGLLRTPAWEYDMQKAIDELRAENKQLRQQLAELSDGGAKDEES